MPKFIRLQMVLAICAEACSPTSMFLARKCESTEFSLCPESAQIPDIAILTH